MPPAKIVKIVSLAYGLLLCYNTYLLKYIIYIIGRGVALMGVRKTFRRGVHPKGGKEFSANVPIRVIDAEDVMVFPLSQHIGAPAKPLVQKGDRLSAAHRLTALLLKTTANTKQLKTTVMKTMLTV